MDTAAEQQFVEDLVEVRTLARDTLPSRSAHSSRALAVAMTHLDTAILWAGEDLRLKVAESEARRDRLGLENGAPG